MRAQLVANVTREFRNELNRILKARSLTKPEFTKKAFDYFKSLEKPEIPLERTRTGYTKIAMNTTEEFKKEFYSEAEKMGMPVSDFFQIVVMIFCDKDWIDVQEESFLISIPLSLGKSLKKFSEEKGISINVIAQAAINTWMGKKSPEHPKMTAEEFKTIRKNAGLPQMKLKIMLGVSQGMITNYENGYAGISENIAKKMLEIEKENEK